MAASIGRQAGRQAEGAGEGVPWTANMNGSRKGGKHTGGKHTGGRPHRKKLNRATGKTEP